MSTYLILGLVPGNESRIVLERLQAAIQSECPEACALPPFVPLGYLSRQPAEALLFKAKTVVWPRQDLNAAALTVTGNCLAFALPPFFWQEYQKQVWSALDQAPNREGMARLEIGPWLYLAGPWESSTVPTLKTMDRVTINAPTLTVFRVEELEFPGGRRLFWEILAEHRVAKQR
jgi:hypothetical protein